MPDLVRQLAELRAADLPAVGGKAANLGELIRGGAPVPPGFVVTTSAYDLATTAVRDELLALAAVDDHDVASERIRALVTASPIPAEIEQAVRTAYRDVEGAVAVRSSATAEDLAEASFAGQQDTYLNIIGADAVLDAVRECWASLWTARAIDYRDQQGIPADEVSLAVVVQRLVDARAAGVMFTADPGTGRRDVTLVSAAWGLGEAVVSGQVSTDDLTVIDGAVTERHTADKEHRTVRLDFARRAGEDGARRAEGDGARRVEGDGARRAGEDGVELVPVPEDLRRAEVLTDAQAVELARLGRTVADRFGRPQDLEWVLDTEGAFWLVQSRPITALPEPAGPMPTDWSVPHPWSMYVRVSIVEQMPDPLSPLFADLAAEAVPTGLARMFRSYLGVDVVRPGDIEFPTINGYAYYSYAVGFWARCISLLRHVPKIMAAGETSGPQRWDRVAHPQYVATVAEARERDLTAASAYELLELARALLTSGCEYYSTVQAVIPPVAMAETSFTGFYTRVCRRFLGPDAPAPEVFLLGGDSAPIRAEQSLYDLATWTRQDDVLTAVLLAGDDRMPDVVEVPDGVSPARWAGFCQRFADHLEQYGHAVFNLDFIQPVAADHPGPVLDALRFYLRGAGQNPQVRQRRLRQEAEAARAEVMARLPRALRRRFGRLLDKAISLAPYREDALADVGLAWPLLRRALLVLGERLVDAGALAEPGQVFWLTEAEVIALARKIDAGEQLADASAPIAGRRETWRGQALATPPGILPLRSVWRVWDRWMPTTGREQTGPELRGTAASGGRVTARARVLHGPEDFADLQPGEVLVAAITTPAWTPLFAMASAVVTDVGGPLSHSSIVAREYGIPAVLGTSVATSRIHTGELIAVDGRAGTVSWVDEDEAQAGAEPIPAVVP